MWEMLSPLGTSGVRGDDDTALDVQVLADPAKGAGLGVQVVDRDVEESLDLGGVEVHCDDVVTSSGLEHVGHQAGGDGGTRLVLLVLARVGEVGQDGRDTARRGRLAGVDHDEELHDAVVDLSGGGGLQDEDVFVADGFADCDGGFLVGVLEDEDAGEFYAESVASHSRVSDPYIGDLQSLHGDCAIDVSRRVAGAYVPVGDELRELRVTVASQQLYAIGGHDRGCACCLLQRKIQGSESRFNQPYSKPKLCTPLPSQKNIRSILSHISLCLMNCPKRRIRH